MNFRCLFALGLVGCLSALGCGRGSSPDAEIGAANKTNLQRLANLYVLHQFQNKFKGPKDEAAFKAFIAATDAGALSKMGVQVSEVDQLFVCDQDDQPFKIKYGVPTGPRGSQEAVIFQSQGSRGMKMVGFLNMVQREVDDAEYEQLWGSKVAPPPRNDNRNVNGPQ
jgi:hypothetical protein